jgi:hypothetical protein
VRPIKLLYKLVKIVQPMPIYIYIYMRQVGCVLTDKMLCCIARAGRGEKQAGSVLSAVSGWGPSWAVCVTRSTLAPELALLALCCCRAGVVVLAHDIDWRGGQAFWGKPLPVCFGPSVISDYDEARLQVRQGPGLAGGCMPAPRHVLLDELAAKSALRAHTQLHQRWMSASWRGRGALYTPGGGHNRVRSCAYVRHTFFE